MCRVSLKEMSGSICLSPYSKMSKIVKLLRSCCIPYRVIPLERVENGSRTRVNETVAVESDIEIRVDGQLVTALSCSPGLERELAIGHVLSSGVIKSPAPIMAVDRAGRVCNVKLRSYAPDLTAGMKSSVSGRQLSKAGHDSGQAMISAQEVGAIGQQLESAQALHGATGGAHAALIEHSETHELVVAEDLSRHNAVDKVIGLAVLKEFDLTKYRLFVTGRLTSDLVRKCIRVSLPLVVSYAVATDTAVAAARAAGLTVLGSLKASGFWLYNEGAVKVSP